MKFTLVVLLAHMVKIVLEIGLTVRPSHLVVAIGTVNHLIKLISSLRNIPKTICLCVKNENVLLAPKENSARIYARYGKFGSNLIFELKSQKFFK